MLLHSKKEGRNMESIIDVSRFYKLAEGKITLCQDKKSDDKKKEPVEKKVEDNVIPEFAVGVVIGNMKKAVVYDGIQYEDIRMFNPNKRRIVCFPQQLKKSKERTEIRRIIKKLKNEMVEEERKLGEEIMMEEFNAKL